MTGYRAFSLSLLVSLAAPVMALAQGVEPDRAEDRWAFAVGAYLFAANIDGVMTIGPKEIDASLSFDELIGSVDAVFPVHFEAGFGFHF